MDTQTNPQQPQKVQLGCGTLIVIALIVMLFSGDRSDRRMRKEMRELRETIERLEKKIDAMQAAPAPAPAPAP